MMRAWVVLGVLGALWALRRGGTAGAAAPRQPPPEDVRPIGRQRPRPSEPGGRPALGGTGPAPDPIWPLGGRARWERWGAPEWRHVGEGRVEFDPEWEREHLVQARIPELGGRTVTLHRDAVAPLRAWLRDGIAEGLITPTQRIDVDRVPRLQRRHGVYGEWPSSHAYGTAWDLDPERYPESSQGGAAIRRLGELAARHGIGWGGLFSDPDPMHFEVVE